MVELKINGEDKIEQAVEEYSIDSIGRRTAKETYNLKQGLDKYNVRRKYARILDITQDLVSAFGLIVICMHNRIVVRNNADNLFTNFEELRTPRKFKDTSPPVVENGIIKHLYKEYEDILFPGLPPGQQPSPGRCDVYPPSGAVLVRVGRVI